MKFANRVLNHRIPIFAAIVILFCLSIPGLLRLDITVEIADYFIEGDDALRNQERFEQIFGKNDFVGVLFESNDIFSTPSLEKINEIGDRIIDSIPYAESIQSITDLDPRELGGNKFVFNEDGKLISSQSEQERTRTILINDPSLAGTLFSETRKEAWVMVPLAFKADTEIPNEFELGELVYRTISAIDCDSSMTITAAGLSVYAYRKKAEMLEDLSTVLMFGALVAFLLCLVTFRKRQTVLATLSLIIFSPIIVLGTLGWLNLSADSAFISVPILLTMGVSIGNAVHINHFFGSHFDKTGRRKDAVVYALERTWRPILFTAITTIAALLSFSFVQVKPIIWVGLVSAACILVLYGLCMLFFPMLLSMGKDKAPVLLSVRRKLIFEVFFDIVANYIIKHQILLTLIFAAITMASFYGSSKVKIDFNAEKMMGTKLDHMKDQVKIKHSDISSNEFMDLTIAGKPDWFKDSIYICRLEALQGEIDLLPLVKRTSSILQITSKVNRIFHQGDNKSYFTPKEQSILDRLFSSIEYFTPDYLRNWTTEDYSTTRIFIEMSDFSSRTIQDNIHQIDTLVSRYFPRETEHFLSGSTYQMALMNQYITKGLVKSIGISLIFITLLMMVCFRSVKLGLVAMFPNVFPVIVCGAIVGYANIPLEFVTMTVAPLILGLAVDDTIHFISSLKTNITKTGNYKQGIEKAYGEVGVAITKTTIILSCTFLVFAISDIQSTFHMGLLSSAGITAAYLADIFVVPILITWMKPFKIG